MSSANHPTCQPQGAGYFLLTVELDPVAGHHSFAQHRGLARLTNWLSDLLLANRLAATWAVGDPAHSAATSTVVGSGAPHEMAILGDPNWLGPTAGRTRFARELSRRVAQARRAEIDVATLVPRVASVERDIDLVVKQSIRAVAGVGQASHRRVEVSAPWALHYGVWEMPVSARLPAASSWWTGGRRSLWRRIRRAAHAGATFHLAVDVPAIEHHGPAGQRAVQWLVERVAQLRDRGLVKSETLGQAAARLSDVPARSPQQSILRRAS